MLERGTALRNPIRGTLAGCCASTAEQSAKSMAQNRQNILALGILECWKNGFNGIVQPSIIPSFHYSIIPVVHLITRSALAKTLGGIASPFLILDFRF
jgi:hypothetical protein